MVDLKVHHEESLRLLEQLTEFLETDSHLDKLPRILLLYSNKVANEDEFVRYLYSQQTLDSPPSQLREIFPFSSGRVEHGFEVACKKDHMRQLVAALEKSGNSHIISKILKRLETLINNNENEAPMISSEDNPLEEDVDSNAEEQSDDTLFNGNQKLLKFYFWPSGQNGQQNSMDENDTALPDDNDVDESNNETGEATGHDEDFLASIESQIVTSNETDEQRSLQAEDEIQSDGIIEEPVMQRPSARVSLFCTPAPPADESVSVEDEQNDAASENEDDNAAECLENTISDREVSDDNQETENTEQGDASSEEKNDDEVNHEDEESDSETEENSWLRQVREQPA